MRLIDLTGQRFGRLVVIERAEDYIDPTGHRYTMWLCRCDCGSMTTPRSQHLRNGRSKSCGCYNIERAHRPLREDVTYQGAHSRVRAARGRPKYHACVDCGVVAQDWSYDHTDPDERTGLLTMPRGEQRVVAYSVKPEHFSPRCKRCHVAFDRQNQEETSDA